MSLKDIKEEYLDFSQAVVGLSVLAAMPLGFLYLLSYSVVNHVPIPLTLSELPTLLLAVMALGTMFASIFLGVIFLPTLARSRVFGNTFTYMYGANISSPSPNPTDSDGAASVTISGVPEESQRRKNGWLFLLTLGIPLFFFLVLLLTLSLVPVEYRLWKNFAVIAGMASGITSVVMGIAKNFPKERRAEVHATVWSLLLVCAYWSLLVLLMILKGLAAFLLELPTWAEVSIVIAAILFMLGFLYVMVVPWSTAPPLPVKFWVTMGAMVVLLPPLVSPMSERLCGFALKAMHIGGGYETVYTVKKEIMDSLPCQILNHDGLAQTVRVQVVLDLGERIYLRVGGEMPTQVYAIPRDAIVAQIL